MKFIYILLIIVTFPIFANEGKCESGDCTNGKGVFTFTDGRKYDGEFKNKEMNGSGILYF